MRSYHSEGFLGHAGDPGVPRYCKVGKSMRLSCGGADETLKFPRPGLKL